MSNEALRNLAVELVVSDPWEFGSECGTGPFPGMISSADESEILIRFAAPIVYRGRSFVTAVARPRHAGLSIVSVVSGPLAANIVLLPDGSSERSTGPASASPDGTFVVGSVELAAGGKK